MKCTLIIFYSILVSSCLCNTLGKFGLPYFTMPFNLVAICVFLPKTVPKEEDISEGVIVYSIDWYGVGKGIALSMGQVYAINDMGASTLMNIAVFLYSPLLFITSTIGAIVGSLAGKYLIFFYKCASFAESK